MAADQLPSPEWLSVGGPLAAADAAYLANELERAGIPVRLTRAPRVGERPQAQAVLVPADHLDQALALRERRLDGQITPCASFSSQSSGSR